ncbi:MAG: UbiA prenyltransferase family protein, partial [Nitrososphaerota archaeon]|nr:UbiA prenyltransferase family protein [Nitrososphaerota archaeon]
STISGVVVNSARLARSRLIKASVYTFSTLAGILIATRGHFSPEVLLLAPLSTLLISLAVYVLNDLSDLEVDRINAPNRPLARQVVSKREGLGFVLVLSGLGTAIGYVLGPFTFVIALLEILVGVLYSIRPFNFKDRFIVKTLSIGAGGILANLFGGVASGIVNLDLIFCSAMFLIFIFSTSPLNDLADYVGDKSHNRKTIPIVIGPERTIKLSILTSIAPPIFALIFFKLLSFNPLSILLLALITIRSLQLLLPLAKTELSFATVRKHQKKMVYLHFLLQGALVVGSFAL